MSFEINEFIKIDLRFSQKKLKLSETSMVTLKFVFIAIRRSGLVGNIIINSKVVFRTLEACLYFQTSFGVHKYSISLTTT